jgi:hypothetical protein
MPVDGEFLTTYMHGHQKWVDSMLLFTVRPDQLGLNQGAYVRIQRDRERQERQRKTARDDERERETARAERHIHTETNE